MSEEGDMDLIDPTQADTQSLTQTQSGSLPFSLTPNSQENKPVDPYGRLTVHLIGTKRLGMRFKLGHNFLDKIATIELTKEKISVGRGLDCDICLSKLVKDSFMDVSTLHFSLLKHVIDDRNSPVFIEDSSTNGTFIEKRGRSVKKEERLSLKSNQLDKGESRYILADKDVIYIQKNPTIAFRFESLKKIENDLPADINKMYHVGRELGSGACGTVYYVQDRRKCTPYALKYSANDENHMHTLCKEVELLRNLKHPCILCSFYVRTYVNSVAIYLEYMAGGDLLSRIEKYKANNKHMSESLGKFIFYQMCSGVKYLHDERVTHRDLKPANILLATDADYTLIKISDFGLSKRVQNNSQLKTRCGTKMYLAPEVCSTRFYTNKVDIWSLGIILYNCLSNRMPFTFENYEKNPGDIHFNHESWKNISDEAISLIRDALEVNPYARPSIEELLERKWLSIHDQYIKMALEFMAR